MASFRMKIAGAVAEVQSLFDSTPHYFRPYLTTETAEFSVVVRDSDLRFEQAELDREAVEEGFRFRTFTDPFLERAAIQRAFAETLFDRDILLLHGSAVAVDGKGYLFMARSGTGKSTHTRLWRELFGERAVMINDDKPFVAVTAEGVTIFGSPWSGKHGLDSNIAVPLRGICLLERGGEDCIRAMSAEEAMPMLRKQAYCPMERKKEENLFYLVDKLAKKVPLYHMECTKNRLAAQVASAAMHGAASITLRPFAPDDAEAVMDMLMDDRVKQTYMVPDFASREKAKPLFDRLMALSHDESRFVRAISADGKAVGMIHDVDISGGVVEVGYAIDSRHWGRGYATRALQSAMEALFDRGFETVKAAAFEENTASFRVMEKAGMVKTTQAEEIQYRGKNHRCIYYEKNKN